MKYDRELKKQLMDYLRKEATEEAAREIRDPFNLEDIPYDTTSLPQTESIMKVLALLQQGEHLKAAQEFEQSEFYQSQLEYKNDWDIYDGFSGYISCRDDILIGLYKLAATTS